MSSPEAPGSDASRDREGEASDLGVTPLGIWALAWPTMLAMGSATIVRMTDFAMVRELGPSATAAIGVGGNFYWLIESLASVPSLGLMAIVARAVGAGDRALAGASHRQAHLQGIVLALLGGALVFPATELAIGIYGVESDVVALASDYLWWRLWGTVPLAIAMSFGSALRAAGDVRTPLWAGLVAGVVNVFMNWVLIYGKLGAPALGVTGAAIASNLALTVMMIHFVFLWLTKRMTIVPDEGSWRPDFDLQRRIFRVGFPSGLEGGLFQIGLMLFQRVMSTFGTNVIAAYNVGSMLLSFSFMPGVGFSIAASTLVGQHLGARDPDRAAREGWRAMFWAIVTMTGIGLALAIFARPIAEGFTTDPEVVELSIVALTIFAVAHPLMAIEFALGGGLRGAGDTVFPLLCVFSGLVVVRLGIATGLVVFLGAPIAWVWSVLILDYALKAVLFVERFRRGSWKRRVV
ncbi:MAG: MATE family efflux transporter [bacterium]|nr:MATE family efflux transporter [bacterium]